jgi:hypothetical protein
MSLLGEGRPLTAVSGWRNGAGQTVSETPASSGVPLKQLLFPALAVAAVVATLTAGGPYRTVPLLLGAVAGAYVLVPNNLAWVLVPILITELSIRYWMIAELGMSLRLATVIVATAVALPAILKGTQHDDPYAKRVLVPGIIFVSVATVMNMMHSDGEYVFKYLRFQSTQLFTLVVLVSVVRDWRTLKRLLLIVLGLTVISGFGAIWQHYSRTTAFYGAHTAASAGFWKGRSVGLSDSPVLLANDMTLVLLPLLGLAAAGAYAVIHKRRTRLQLMVSTVVIAGGMYFTYTRSALYAAGVGLLVMGLYLRGRHRKLVLGTLLVLALMFQLLQGTGVIGARYYKTSADDQSAATHEALWQIGFAMALDHWLVGIGHQRFEELALDYSGAVNPDLQHAAVGAASERPHNDFLSVWISWGIVALIAHLALYIGSLANCAVAARHHNLIIRGLAIGCAGGLATYAANSAFHNYMDSSAVLWLYAGLSVVLARLPSDMPAWWAVLHAGHVPRRVRRHLRSAVLGRRPSPPARHFVATRQSRLSQGPEST